MASAKTQEIFPCTPAQFYKIISDYEKYPEFLPEVKKCTLIKTEGGKKLVEFQVALMKSFKYQLWMSEVENISISWTFHSGEVFKSNDGSWHLQADPAGVKVDYAVDAGFSLFVPGPIAKALVSVNLPMMMKSYLGRVQKLYGK